MSKIHEALKKAEEEKMAGNPASRPVQSVLDESLMPGLPSPVAAPAVTPRFAGSDPMQPLSWEMIASRCAQRVWKPSKEMLFVGDNNHHEVGTEEFRTLRSRLYRLREKRPLKSIMVGSALPAEGKTFVSANLAQTLARQHGRRVVLLDCDLRRSRLHESFGTSGEPGISDYLRGEADELSILQRGPMENLAFIPGGRSISNPAELIGNGRLETLLQRLGNVFEWIVIDSPPAVPVADASLIGRICDGILLVVQAAKTPFDLAQRARNEFRNMPVLGVVLNRVEAGSTYVSYYYSGYSTPGATAQE
jgi:succinoglycan biosynthesis transport protein ExoP